MKNVIKLLIEVAIIVITLAAFAWLTFSILLARTSG